MGALRPQGGWEECGHKPETPAATGSWKRQEGLAPRALGETQPCPHLDFYPVTLISDSSWERIDFCYFEALSLWCFVSATQGTNPLPCSAWPTSGPEWEAMAPLWSCSWALPGGGIPLRDAWGGMGTSDIPRTQCGAGCSGESSEAPQGGWPTQQQQSHSWYLGAHGSKVVVLNQG